MQVFIHILVFLQKLLQKYYRESNTTFQLILFKVVHLYKQRRHLSIVKAFIS